MPVRNILLIEDDEEDYLIVTALFQELAVEGYRLEWVDSFHAGLERLLHGGFDACLLDYLLGARTGIELLRAAQARDCDVPIIMLTGMRDRQTDLAAMRSGAVDYLIKDELTASMLERALRYAVERASSMARLKLMAVELEKARDEALQASHAKSLFLSRVSHELRTPLSAIIGYSELIGLELKNEGHRLGDAALEVQSCGQSLLSLIDELLDITKAEIGQLDVSLQTFDVLPLLDEIVTTMKPLFQQSSNEFRFSPPEGLGNMVSDRSRLRQILLNLLGNACKFTSHGTIDLVVRALKGRSSAENNGGEPTAGFIEFAIKDTGIGITKEQLSRLFQDFTQAHSDISREYGGNGLGLAISDSLTRLLGGEIQVESQYGVGSTFRVVLPRISRRPEQF